MISYRRERTIAVSGCELTAVSRVSLITHTSDRGWFLSGDKRPIAIICRTDTGECIFDADGHQIDETELDVLMTDCRT